MTIALGILAGHGAVLAADSQETDGVGFKDFALKIKSTMAMTNDPPRSAVAVTGCGPGLHLDAISREIIDLANSRTDWSRETFEPELKTCIRNFFVEHVTPLLPHIDNRFNLIVAAQFDGKSWLWSNDTTVVERRYPFEALGTGKNYAKTAIDSRILGPTIEQAVLLAIHGVSEAKNFDQYCGKSTKIVCLFNNSAHHLPWYLVDPVEKFFDRYSGVEHSVFHYVLGHFDEESQKNHVRKLASWHRKMRIEAVSLAADISKELSR